MASCANAAYAYKPYWWYQPPAPGAPTPNAACSAAPICVNLVEVGGEQNVVSGVTQQCGTITNITNVLKANPALAALTLLLFVALAVVMAIRADPARLVMPPPPPSDIFDGL
jgi:hypothetical protein